MGKIPDALRNLVRGNQMSRISCLTLDARRCPGIRLVHRPQESRE
jgi:hypothetical protein